MNINKPVNIPGFTFTPLKWLTRLGVFILIAIMAFKLFNGREINNKYKNLKEDIKRSEAAYDSIKHLRFNDSIVKAGLRDSIADVVILRNEALARAEHYKNKWYIIYKKFKVEEDNYNNAADAARDSIAAAVAKE